MNQTILKAGTAVTDITPPLEVGLLTSSVKGLYEPFQSVRTPLKARVLLLKKGSETIALVSLDLLALNSTAVGGWEAFKKGLSDQLSPEKIIITCTHSHNAPESVALSGLYLTKVYQIWLSNVQHKIRQAIEQAAASAIACTVSVAAAVLEGYSLQRRIPTPNGIIMSDTFPVVPPELMDREPVDRRVRTVVFRNGEGNAIATLVHALCHPVHEMCLPHISAEFPGEMCTALEQEGGYGMPLYLNGAAGDINPPTVSAGPAFAQQHGVALADAAVTAQQNSTPIDVSEGIGFIHHETLLRVRPEANMNDEQDAMARLNVLRLGTLAFVFLPGEPFVETALAIEQHSPFENTIVVAYAENTIGYIPTAKAYEEGGYEAGPGKWSYLKKGSDEVIQGQVTRLLKELYNTNVPQKI